MAFLIERTDLLQPDVVYLPMPQSRETVEAERLFRYCMLEADRQDGKLGCFWNRQGRKHLEGSLLPPAERENKKNGG